MRITAADIARESGVSIATVDRVLNDRPGVKPRTRDIVMSVARRLGYLPEGDGGGTPPIRLRIVLPRGTNAFVASLQHHIEELAAQRHGLSVAFDSLAGLEPEALARAIRAGIGQCEGMGVIAPDHPAVREAMRAAVASGVQLVTIATDISDVGRIGYVGIDNRQAGRLAGYVLGRFLGGGPGKVAVFAGSLAYRGHEEREMGFRHVLRTEFPRLDMLALSEMRDERERAFNAACAMLDATPDLAAIYNIGAGNDGIAEALKVRGRAQSVLFIGHEATRGNRDLLLDGTMDALIDQNPRVEAREALNMLMSAVRGESYAPHQPRVQVIFKENIPEF